MVLNNTLPNVGLSDKKMADVRKLRLRLLFGPEIAVGPGKVALLKAIRETGSISAAARRMNMSYRRAWLLVDTMNRCFRKPLVDSSPGGKGGGGSGDGRVRVQHALWRASRAGRVLDIDGVVEL